VEQSRLDPIIVMLYILHSPPILN